MKFVLMSEGKDSLFFRDNKLYCIDRNSIVFDLLYVYKFPFTSHLGVEN